MNVDIVKPDLYLKVTFTCPATY